VAFVANNGDEQLVKSKQRVADHGEVFTPEWLVDAMLNLVKAETERIDSRFLEPTCGSGNFLVQVLHRKLTAVEILRVGQPPAPKVPAPAKKAAPAATPAAAPAKK